ncbi:Marvel-containing potential lipid raft-associated protein [Fasciola hepatica]|uniref:Marvel-containing potential lipid raft-associated protein n=1 Tax=Fasciola hepatica TaxID=6192 RepID=A0A4E0RCG1_FASHE|nr:Marvel-containing potential lipid raft-associated protein [Fasciola hepatica]
MDRTATTYETTYETEQVDNSTVNTAFVKNLSGILKLLEVVLSCIVIICVSATGSWSSYASGGWMNFVAALTLIFAALFYIFYLFNLIRRLRGPWIIIEFATLVVSVVFWFIAFIVAASMSRFGPGAIAAAVFSVAAMSVYIAELVTRFRVSKQAGGFRITMTGVKTVTAPVSAHPQMTPAPTHEPGYNPNETRIAFGGAYAPGEHADDGYVMP